jgi:branched-chain amino acid aminotransferase
MALSNLIPCTKVLHYGQEIFEGMKAYKKSDDEVYLFRPYENAKRFNHSARRMAMAEFPEEMYVKSAEIIASYSRNVIPRRLGESLYIRPFMIATEVGLGIAPSKQFKYMVVASPSGAYFASDSIKVYIERGSCRAAPGGTGNAKTGGNYAAGLMATVNCNQMGYHQVMWLDAESKTYIEEMSGMNFFAVINGELHTPELTDTILRGITRDSILKIAASMGYKVVERKMKINELLAQVQKGECSEAFLCGTASVIAQVGSFHEQNGEYVKFQNVEGDVASKIKEKMLRIQAALEEAPEKDWNHFVPNFQLH